MTRDSYVIIKHTYLARSQPRSVNACWLGQFTFCWNTRTGWLVLICLVSVKLSSQYDADADVDAGIEINAIPASASVSTSKDAACVKVVSLMLTLS